MKEGGDALCQRLSQIYQGLKSKSSAVVSWHRIVSNIADGRYRSLQALKFDLLLLADFEREEHRIVSEELLDICESGAIDRLKLVQR